MDDRSSHILINTPSRELDLSQAASIQDTVQGYATSAPADLNIARIKRVLEEVITGLTDATQKTFDSQTQYFDTTIKEFMGNVQEALNDIDERLNYLSRSQAQTEQVLDSLIKLWLLGGTDANVDEQKLILEAFIARGMQPVTEPANGTPA